MKHARDLFLQQAGTAIAIRRYDLWNLFAKNNWKRTFFPTEAASMLAAETWSVKMGAIVGQFPA